MARRMSDLPHREVHPVGYTILRVDASAVDGLPLARFVVPVLRGLRLIGRSPAARAGRADPDGAPPARRDKPLSPASEDADHRPTRGLRAYLGRTRIFFVIRSDRRRASEVAPAADMVHGMAYVGVAVALAVAKRDRAKVVYDARDIYMEAAGLHDLRGPIKAALVRLERGWARAADRVLTVNQPYADELAKRFRVAGPLVVMNCSYRYAPAAERPRHFHDRLDLGPDTRVVLYQGGFMHGRGVEQLVAAIPHVPGAVLAVMGYGSREGEFRGLADRPDNRGRVHVLPAVPPTDLLDWVASADVVGVLFQHDHDQPLPVDAEQVPGGDGRRCPVGVLRPPRHGTHRARDGLWHPGPAGRHRRRRRRDPLDRRGARGGAGGAAFSGARRGARHVQLGIADRCTARGVRTPERQALVGRLARSPVGYPVFCSPAATPLTDSWTSRRCIALASTSSGGRARSRRSSRTWTSDSASTYGFRNPIERWRTGAPSSNRSRPVMRNSHCTVRWYSASIVAQRRSSSGPWTSEAYRRPMPMSALARIISALSITEARNGHDR